MIQEQVLEKFVKLMSDRNKDKEMTDKVMQDEITNFFKGTIEIGGKKYTILDEESPYYEIKDLRVKRFLQNKDSRRREKMNHDKHWIASHLGGVREVCQMFNPAKLSNIILLISFLELDSENKILIDGKPLKPGLFAKKLGKSSKTASRLINELKEIGFLYENEEDGDLYINKKYHEMGQVSTSKNWVKVFKTKIQELHKKCKGGPEVGMLYKILPYINWKTSTICKNPNEEDASKIEPFTCEELAKEVDLDKNTVSDYMIKLSEHGVILISEAHRYVMYKVHPDYAFRRDDHYAEALKDHFTEHQTLMRKQLEKRRNKTRKIKKETVVKEENDDWVEEYFNGKGTI